MFENCMKNEKGQGIVAVIVGIIILIVVIFIISRIVRWIRGDTVSPATSPTPTIAETRDTEVITINDVVQDPDIYAGLQLTLSGRLDNWVTRHSFVLESTEGGLFGSSNRILVVRREPFNLPRDTPVEQLALGENPQLSITGVIGQLKVAELEQEWGEDLVVDLDFRGGTDDLDDFEDQVVIFASSIQKT
jgi:hypothetical protein